MVRGSKPMLLVSVITGSRIVALRDYAFEKQDIDILELISLFCPSHDIQILENNVYRIVHISILHISREEIVKLNMKPA